MQYSITTRRKNKGWQYIISYKDGLNWKQKSKQGFPGSREAKAAAQKKVRELEEAIKSKAKLNKEYEGKTFGEFVKMFTEHLKLYREGNTAISYIVMFRRFTQLNDIGMDKIEPIDIQKCVDTMTKDGLKYTTIKVYLRRLRTAFNYAKTQLKMINSNPVIKIDVLCEKNQPSKKALTQSELSDLLSKIKNPKYRLISILASTCGLRLGEILGLTWDNVDFKQSIIYVKQQWKKKSDGNGGFEYGMGELKSKNSYRMVPIPYKEEGQPNRIDTLAELKKYKKEYPLRIDGRLFNLTSIVSICSCLSDIYAKAGYTITIHELRHTYATTLIANGADFKTVAQLMGHDVKQTLETYSHVTSDMMKHATDIINKFL